MTWLCHHRLVFSPALRRLLLTLAVLTLVGSCTEEAPEGGSASDAGFATAQLTVPRAVHRATVLVDGRVLFSGGCTLPGCDGFDRGQASELFDPAIQLFRVGPQMTTPRAGHTATLLDDGRVLLVGGYSGEGQLALASAEVFDPATNAFRAVGELSGGRADHTATVLPDGGVLIAGGTTGQRDALRSTEWFDPESNQFTSGPQLSSRRSGQAAVFTEGRLVLIGGTADANAAVSTTDVLRDGAWSPGPALGQARIKHAASVLPDQTVLVIGGATSTEGRDLLSSTEVLDLARMSATPGPELSEGQYKLEGAVTRLPDGRVVITGGRRVDVYDPATREMSVLTDPPVSRRSFISASTVAATTVLVAGGYDSNIAPTAAVRLIQIPRTTRAAGQAGRR